MTIEEAVEIVTNELQSDESKYTYKVDKVLSMIQTVIELDESLVTLVAKTIFNEDRMKELVDEAVKEAGLKWIPCSERLPEESGYYLVTNTLWGARRLDIDSFSREGMFWLMTKPIAWMPLPEAYEEEKNADTN